MRKIIVQTLSLVICLVLLHKACAVAAEPLAARTLKTSTCESILQTRTLLLPRELGINQDLTNFMMQSERSEQVLSSLSRIYQTLEDSSVPWNQISSALSEGPNEEMPDETSSEIHDADFFRAQPQLLTRSVEGRYIVLKNTELSSRISTADLALFAYLLRDLPESPKNLAVSFESEAVNTEVTDPRYVVRLRALLNEEKYRAAIVELMSHPIARIKIVMVLMSVSEKMQGPHRLTSEMAFRALDQAADHLAKGRHNPKDRLMAGALLGSVAHAAVNPQVFTFEKRDQMNDTLRYQRTDFRKNLAPYLNANYPDLKHKETLMLALDHYAFGASIPKTREQLRSLVLEKSKSLLLPFKTEFIRSRVVLPTAKPTAVSESTPAFELNLVDHFAPRSSPHIRADKLSKGATSLEMTIKPDDTQVLTAPELRAFSTFVDEPSPLSKLRADILYQFVFLREHQSRIQKVRLSPEVIDWTTGHPDLARSFINSLHMGRARLSGQGGLKLMAQRSSRYEGHVYELKAIGAFRGLMLFVNGTWQFISIVHKDEVDRQITTLAALPEN